MNSTKYEVLIDDDVVASNMDLETATLMVKALFNEYYNDYLTVSVRKMENCDNRIETEERVKEFKERCLKDGQ